MKALQKRIKYFSFISLLIFLVGSCSKPDGYVKSEGMIWNTLYHVTYKGPDSLKDSIIPVLNQVGHSLSVFEDSSLVSRLNNSDNVEADSHLLKVFEESVRIHKLSNGNFDPTLSPLIDAWGFGKGHIANKDTLAIDSILEFVGLDKIYLQDNQIIKKDRRTRFNFSAIAKGYGCDAVAEMFLRNNVENFMVEIGGELSLKGKSPAAKDWTIAVDAPVDDQMPGSEAAIILSLTDAGMATSGNYRNFRIENGKKYAHTISPKNGRPFIGEILSATVIASTCMEADAIATACMAGGFPEAKNLLNETQTEGLLIFADSIWMSPGFEKYIISEF